MITENTFFLVFLFLYLIECTTVFGHGAFIVYSRIYGKRGYTSSGSALHLAGKNIFIPFTVAPWNIFLLCGSRPVVFGRRGLLVTGKSKGTGGEFIDYGNIKTAGVHGTSVVLNETVTVKTHSAAEALQLKNRIISIAESGSGKREKLLEDYYSDMYSYGTVSEELKGDLKRSGFLRVLLGTAFVLAFIISPGAAIMVGLSSAWPYLLTAYVIIHYSAFFSFILFQKRSGMEMKFEDFMNLFSMAFYPPAMLRSVNSFFRYRYITKSPAAVGAYVLKRELLPRFLSEIMRGVIYSDGAGEGEAAEALNFGRDMELEGIRGVLKELEIDEAELLVPERDGDDSAGYCPKCFAQYGTESGTCTDCGIELKEF